MKKLQLPLAVVLIYSSAHLFICASAFAQNLQWAKAIGGTSDDYGRDIAVDTAGNVYTTGYFQGTVDPSD